MKRKKLILAFISIFYSAGLFSQDFYSIDTIQKIEISFSQPNWDYILDTAKMGSDSYTMASWVKINGILFDSAGVKYKGNSSYNPSNAKNPLHIELDHFKDQDYLGYKDIKLSNGYNEPSFVREVMLYDMFRNYAHASRANYAQVYINGQYTGLYTNVESVTKTFLSDRFYSGNNTFVFADNGGCDLRYKGSDSTLYYVPYTLKSDFGWTDLMNLCDTLNNNIAGIENIIDVDRTLWLHAFTNAMVILDSYLGNSKHNYYLYLDHLGRFNPIIWDLNGGLGIFNKPENQTQYTVAQMQTMSPLLHSGDSMWPLVKNILAIPMFKRMYIAHMKTIMDENISNNSYFTFAQYLQSVVDTAVQSDLNKFGTYAQFLSNLTSNTVIGPKLVPGISFLMNARNTYLNSTPEFMSVPPSVTAIQPSDTFPLIGSTVYITAAVSNVSAVYIGSRYHVMQKFSRQLMYDDGLHGDGAPSDGIYGAAISVTSSQIQYYIYAENNDAGIFFPPRAEHAWYTVLADFPLVQPGQLVINELLAINSNGMQNANGDNSDWLELYNSSSSVIYLDNLHLSDDFSDPFRWPFPSGLSIAPYSYLIIWADDGTSATELHGNFKLSGSGEQVILSYPNGLIIDSVSFPAQTDDVSWGRYPNGSGPFVFMPPTFNAANSLSSINEAELPGVFQIYPNPFSNRLQYYFPFAGVRFKMYNILGELVFEKSLTHQQGTISVSLPEGVYFYLADRNGKKAGTGKIIVQQ